MAVICILGCIVSIIFGLILADSDSMWVSKIQHKKGSPYFFARSPYANTKTLFPIYKLTEKKTEPVIVKVPILVPGMTLFCKNGETVTFIKRTNTTVTVQYKGKNYDRPITGIGETLFFEKQ